MFDNLSRYFSDALEHLRGRGRLTENERAELSGNLRRMLLDADVSLDAVKSFTAVIERHLTGPEFEKSISPRQFVAGVLHEELTRMMGGETVPLNLDTAPPRVIVMAGLQGVGKTTTAAKLARMLAGQERETAQKIALASCDVYRPAAVRQLEVLAEQAAVRFYPNRSDRPEEIAGQSLKQARLDAMDVLILDTAGRLHIDDEMMSEAAAICSAVGPVEVLYVVDCMAGQDAAVSARAFNEVLPLTGIVLSKADSDARGGALLSVRHVTGKPIKLIGTGEKTDAIEVFHPERMASRILGMGDIAGLVEKLDDKGAADKGVKLLKKIRKKRSFTIDDMRKQLVQSGDIGGLSEIVDRLPAEMSGRINTEMLGREMSRAIAVIDSMTKDERKRPELFNGSRKRRVAQGAGAQVQDVNRVLKQFEGMRKMMKKTLGLGKQGQNNMMRMLSGQASQGLGGLGGLGAPGGAGGMSFRKSKSGRKKNKRKKRR